MDSFDGDVVDDYDNTLTANLKWIFKIYRTLSIWGTSSQDGIVSRYCAYFLS